MRVLSSLMIYERSIGVQRTSVSRVDFSVRKLASEHATHLSIVAAQN